MRAPFLVTHCVVNARFCDVRLLDCAAGVAIVACVACVACVPKPRPIPPVGPGRLFRMNPLAQCSGTIDTPEVAGALDDDDLVETSGIVASPTHPGVLWAHNDGDDARLFAMTTTGESLGTLIVNIEADDLEDLAAAPCPDLLGACFRIHDRQRLLAARQNDIGFRSAIYPSHLPPAASTIPS